MSDIWGRTENVLYADALLNWRVQKLTLERTP
jgi:hypothetical protein